MSAKPSGGPAFPYHAYVNINGRQEVAEQYDGMSLRDYFAGQALSGQLASLAHPDYKPDSPKNMKFIAEDAYRIADAMLAERAKAVAELAKKATS